jgi:aminopeptidase N
VTLLSDTFALAQAGRVPMASYFSLLSSIPKVKDASRAALFAMASRGLSFLDAATAGTPAQLRVRAAGRSLLAPELTKLTWTPHADDDAEAKNLRAALILQLAHFDDAATIAQARQLYDADEAGQAPLPGSIRSAVIGAVGVHADRARFDRLLARLKAAQGDEDRRLYAEALASGRDPIRAGELMNTALAGIVPPNVASDIPGMVGSTSPLGELAYDFTLANWPALAGLAGNQFAAKYWLLPNAAWQFNDQARAAKLAADQRRIAGPDGDSPAARAVARIELLSLVRQRDAAALERQLTGWRPQRGP